MSPCVPQFAEVLMARWKRLGWCVLAVLAVACGSGGANGPPGQDGEDGRDGQDGSDGQAGPSGKNSLVRFAVEPAGANCQHGGTAVLAGLDTNSNGVLEDPEVTSTAYTCKGDSGPQGTQVLVRLDPEPAGSHCAEGGTAVHSGLDTNGSGTLDTVEVTQTQYVCSGPSGYPTGWAASLWAIGAGEVASGTWFPVGLKTALYKKNPASRLKVTVTDNLGVGIGVNTGRGVYEVRVNGGTMNPRCYQGAHSANSSSWTNDYRFPFATTCLSHPLPAGLYEFEAWVYSENGKVMVGSGINPIMLVEEIPPEAAYGFSMDGTRFDTTSTSYVKASGREVAYSKKSSTTLLKVTLADTLRVGYNQNPGFGTVLVRMDGADTTCSTHKHDAQGTGGNFHNPFVMTCVLTGVPAGSHVFNVWVQGQSGAETSLGHDRSSPLLLIEEISSQGITFSNGSTPSGELSGNWSGVVSRQVQHNVSAPGKTLRVTYSDTFRAVEGCSGRWGFYQLYVDNQPTYCINGQYVYNSGSSAQNHHHPVNQVCMLSGLAPGPHTFSIWSTTMHAWDGTACGKNYFGYGRGQNLLMVEEMP